MLYIIFVYGATKFLSNFVSLTKFVTAIWYVSFF